MQTVQTQMKCSKKLHFIRVYTVCKGKKIFKTKNTIYIFFNHNLTTLDMYNGLSQVYIASNQKEESIRIQGVNNLCFQDPLDMVDIGVTEEVVRNAICLASTTFNVSKWIEGTTEESSLLPPEDGSHLQRQRSNEMKAPENLQQHGSHPVSPRQAQQQAFEPIEIKETSLQQQQQHSAVCLV